MANEEHLAILKQGVEVWNQWWAEAYREKSRFPEVDLRRANLRSVNLQNAYLYGANLSGADLFKADLYKAGLVEANLTGSNLIYSNFEEANLTGAKLAEANLSRANFRKAILNQASFFKSRLFRADLRSAYLCKTNLLWAKLPQANLSGAKLDEADLSMTCLMKANLFEADLRYANLTNANLIEANLEQAILLESCVIRAYFNSAKFTGSCLKDWTFSPDTNFDNIDCLYVYRKENKQERQPSKRDFEPGEFTRLCQEKQDKDRRGYAQTSIRFEKDKPDENSQKLVKLIDTATIEAIFDPYLDDAALDNLIKLQNLGVAISLNIQILTSNKVVKKNNPRLTKAHVEKTFRALSTVGEIRLINKEHRRFMLLSSGVSLIIGMSLNDLSKNEAAYIDSDREDRAFFDSQWDSTQALS